MSRDAKCNATDCYQHDGDDCSRHSVTIGVGGCCVAYIHRDDAELEGQ